ncbi:hypothetical protein EXIGLDRAFT_151560 [Exidia glandulosa HHB12029]|uniref:Uncharacterized protein n=1 Tax=Exidia glandulosa HHB12029 TaxID=1314781 RepID=A0A165QCY5_EXIGL|nr:hypothetical protein EXIGLDRAFT_151560 [Exidia glandulosa HHB12029]
MLTSRTGRTPRRDAEVRRVLGINLRVACGFGGRASTLNEGRQVTASVSHGSVVIPSQLISHRHRRS